jgi:hypothetical protein
MSKVKKPVKQNNYEEGFWCVVPWSILSDKKLPDTAKLLYAELSALSRRDGYCFASNAYLGDVIGKDESNIWRNLKVLSRRGLIHILTKGPKSRNYRSISLSFNRLIHLSTMTKTQDRYCKNARSNEANLSVLENRVLENRDTTKDLKIGDKLSEAKNKLLNKLSMGGKHGVR